MLVLLKGDIMNKNELDTIKQAILNEIEGYEFYKIASHEADHDLTKAAFNNLADEEMKHVEWLKELFMKMTDGSDEPFKLSGIAEPPSPQLYDWSKLDRSQASTGMSVFSIGMHMEQASIAFYQKAKEQTQNEEARKLYDVLIKWEQVHYEQFAKEYESLTEDWWSDQGFAPF